MDITPIKRVLARFEELKDNDRWPTQFDVLEVWIYSLNVVIQDIKNNSLNSEDRYQRGLQLMKNVLAE